MATSVDKASLKLRANNPYSIGEVFTFDDGQSSLDRNPVIYGKKLTDRYYRVTEGDTLGLIAWYAYGDSKYWWLIADTNDIINPFELSTGLELVIPDLDILNTITYV